jgi:hypothetical protein
VTTASTSATLTWNTNVTGSSVANYCVTTQYGYTASDPTLMTGHSLTLNLLACNTTDAFLRPVFHQFDNPAPRNSWRDMSMYTRSTITSILTKVRVAHSSGIKPVFVCPRSWETETTNQEVR